MKVIIHSKPAFTSKLVRLFTYSIAFKRYPKWVYLYDCEYFLRRKTFHKERTAIFNSVIERLYEAIHDIPDCDCCEERCEDSYSDTRRIMVEDRD